MIPNRAIVASCFYIKLPRARLVKVSLSFSLSKIRICPFTILPPLPREDRIAYLILLFIPPANQVDVSE